jgi:anti-anti-sigma factor
MRVSYRVEETAAGTIISVFDDIDLANATMLADALFTLVDAHRAIVVDLRGLRYIDSVGLHILLRAAQRAERLGCEMTLVAAGPTRQLVERVGLDRLMSIVADIPPAHEQARPSPPAAAPITAPSIAARSVSPQPDVEPETKPDNSVKPTEPSRSDR